MAPLCSSTEVNLLVYHYLKESGFHHASFALRHESRLDDSPLSHEAIIEPGQLIRFLQRGLIYSAVEAHVQEDGTEKVCSAPFKLIGPPHVCDGKPRPPPPAASPARLSPSPPPALAPPRSSHKDAATQTATVILQASARKLQNGSHSSASSLSGSRRLSDDRDLSSKVASSSKKKLDDTAAEDVDMADAESTGASSSTAKDAKRKASASLAVSSGEREDKRAKRDEPAVEGARKKRLVNGSVDDEKSAHAVGKNGKSGSSRGSSPGPVDKGLDVPALSERSGGSRAKDKDALKKKKSAKAGLDREGKKDGKGDKGAGNGKLASTTVEQPQGPGYVTSDEMTVLAGHTGEVFGSDWNPTVPGMLASGAGDATVRIWDLPQRPGDPVEPPTVCKHLPATQSKDISTLHWNPDGTLLASGSYDGILRLWTPQGDLHLVMSMHQGAVVSVRWNRKGNMLLTGSADGTAIVWDLSSGKTRQQFPLHSDSVLDVEWLSTAEGSAGADANSGASAAPTHGLSTSVADSIFATCSADNSINICKLGEARPIKSFKGHTDEVNAIRFDPSRTLLASVSDDCSAKIWALELGGPGSNGSAATGAAGEGQRKRPARGRGGSEKAEGADAEEDKERSAKGAEGEAGEKERGDADRGTPSLPGGGPNTAGSASGGGASTKDGAAGGASAVSGGHAVGGASGHSKSSSTSNVVTTTAKGPNKGLRLTLAGHTKEVYAVAWCPTGPGTQHPDRPRMLATSSFDWTARLWNADNGECLRVIDSHEDNVYTLSFSHCARFLATGGIDKRVLVTRVEDGALIKRYVGGGPIFGLSWKSLPDSKSDDVDAGSAAAEVKDTGNASDGAATRAASAAGDARQYHLAISQADRKLVVLRLKNLDKADAVTVYQPPVPTVAAKQDKGGASEPVVTKKEKKL